MKLLFSAACLMLCIVTNAQTTNETINEGQGTKSFFVELGGPGILFSANLDGRFKKSAFGLGGRAGLGFVSGYGISGDFNSNTSSDRQESVLTVPLQVNYLFGKTSSVNAFEIGAGITVAGKKLNIFDYNDEDKPTSIFGTASFMYRRMPKNGGFSLRAGFTPIISNGYIAPFGALSIGYNF